MVCLSLGHSGLVLLNVPKSIDLAISFRGFPFVLLVLLLRIGGAGEAV